MNDKLDLIDRAALLEIAAQQGRVTVDDIIATPTIDPIHAAGGCYCRECEHCYKNHCTYGGSCEPVADNHFCSYGKVRTE